MIQIAYECSASDKCIHSSMRPGACCVEEAGRLPRTVDIAKSEDPTLCDEIQEGFSVRSISDKTCPSHIFQRRTEKDSTMDRRTRESCWKLGDRKTAKRIGDEADVQAASGRFGVGRSRSQRSRAQNLLISNLRATQMTLGHPS